MAFSPPISGKDGAFYLADYGGTPAEIANIKSWSVNATANEVDTSGFSDDGWGSTVAGLKKWTGTVEGQWNYSATSGMDDLWDNLGDKVAVKFYVDESNTAYFTGNATVTAVNPQTSVDSSATFTGNLSGVGALTYATA